MSMDPHPVNDQYSASCQRIRHKHAYLYHKHFPSMTRSLTLTLMLLCSSDALLAEDSLYVEEVLVTAQKREQKLEDVPISVAVVGGRQVEEFAIRTTADLDNFVSGLVIQETPQNLSTITVRGVGTAAGNESYDQSVSLFIDGVFAGKTREFQTSLFDVNRIEVIKGTQNTLMGKNTSLGAISLFTNRPGDELSATLEASYETEYQSRGGSGAIDLPFGPVKFRLAFNLIDDRGYIKNATTGNEVPEREQSTVRLNTTIDLGENSELFVSYQYDDLYILGDIFQLTEDSNATIRSLAPSTELRFDDRKTSRVLAGDGGEAYDDQISERAAIGYTLEFNDMQLDLLSGWSSYTNERVVDSDWTAEELLFTTYDTNFEQFTQELRLTSPTGGTLEYILGIHYLTSNYDTANLVDANFPTIGFISVQGATFKTYEQDTEAWSVFGHSTLNITARQRLSLGLRFTDEDKDAMYGNTIRRPGPGVGIIPVFAPTPLARSESATDGSVNYQFDLNSDTMLYASWARGSKSGGFTDAANTPATAEYKEEVAKTTELGSKSVWLEGRAGLNAALFYIDIKDFQIVTFNGLGFDTDNVPAESKGVEMDGYVFLSEAARLYGGLTWADAERSDNHTQLPQSPRLTANLGLGYRWQGLFGSNLNLNSDTVLTYRDKMYNHLDEVIETNSATRVDLRLALSPASQAWELALVGRNLTDEEVESFGFEYPLLSNLFTSETIEARGLEPPRTLTLQFTLRLE